MGNKSRQDKLNALAETYERQTGNDWYDYNENERQAKYAWLAEHFKESPAVGVIRALFEAGCAVIQEKETETIFDTWQEAAAVWFSVDDFTILFQTPPTKGKLTGKPAYIQFVRQYSIAEPDQTDIIDYDVILESDATTAIIKRAIYKHENNPRYNH